MSELHKIDSRALSDLLRREQAHRELAAAVLGVDTFAVAEKDGAILIRENANQGEAEARSITNQELVELARKQQTFAEGGTEDEQQLIERAAEFRLFLDQPLDDDDVSPLIARADGLILDLLRALRNRF